MKHTTALVALVGLTSAASIPKPASGALTPLTPNMPQDVASGNFQMVERRQRGGRKGGSSQQDKTPPVKQDTPPPVKQENKPPVKEENKPPVKQDNTPPPKVTPTQAPPIPTQSAAPPPVQAQVTQAPTIPSQAAVTPPAQAQVTQAPVIPSQAAVSPPAQVSAPPVPTVQTVPNPEVQTQPGGNSFGQQVAIGVAQGAAEGVGGAAAQAGISAIVNEITASASAPAQPQPTPDAAVQTQAPVEAVQQPVQSEAVAAPVEVVAPPVEAAVVPPPVEAVVPPPVEAAVPPPVEAAVVPPVEAAVAPPFEAVAAPVEGAAVVKRLAVLPVDAAEGIFGTAGLATPTRVVKPAVTRAFQLADLPRPTLDLVELAPGPFGKHLTDVAEDASAVVIDSAAGVAAAVQETAAEIQDAVVAKREPTAAIKGDPRTAVEEALQPRQATVGGITATGGAPGLGGLGGFIRGGAAAGGRAAAGRAGDRAGDAVDAADFLGLFENPLLLGPESVLELPNPGNAPLTTGGALIDGEKETVGKRSPDSSAGKKIGKKAGKAAAGEVTEEEDNQQNVQAGAASSLGLKGSMFYLGTSVAAAVVAGSLFVCHISVIRRYLSKYTFEAIPEGSMHTKLHDSESEGHVSRPGFPVRTASRSESATDTSVRPGQVRNLIHRTSRPRQDLAGGQKIIIITRSIRL
ncbi:hypothetical protein QBC44DRAFT_404548 [Cladorrhinum sp. PSN332]|nr:hypothetical protein QBC44DRAFT_404548 [Cladorrhinum sp. PSN332]